MTHYNRFQVEGNIVEDCKLSYTNSGLARASFSIANEVYMGKGKPTHTSFFPITIWGKFAERTAPKLIKGCTVFISCTGRIEKYKDKNGVDRYPFKCTIGPTDIIRFTYKSKEAQQRHEQLKNQSNNTQQQQYFNNSSRPEYRVPSTGNPVVGQPVQSQGAQQVLDIFEGDFQDDIPF